MKDRRRTDDTHTDADAIDTMKTQTLSYNPADFCAVLQDSNKSQDMEPIKTFETAFCAMYFFPSRRQTHTTDRGPTFYDLIKMRKRSRFQKTLPRVF